MRTDSPEFDRALSGPGPIPVPPGLADRITDAVVWDSKVRKFTRRAAWTGAAAAVLVAVWFAVPRTGRDPQPVASRLPMPQLIDPFRAADSALASLSRSAADRVTSTVPTLPTPADIFSAPVAAPAGPTVSDLPDSARTAFEPVTAATTRAFGRFFQDLGSATGAARGGS